MNSTIEKHKYKQKGGRAQLPSQYYGGEIGNYYSKGNEQLQMGSSAYGQSYPVSHGTDLGNGMMGPDLAPYESKGTSHSNIQTGGGGGDDNYNFIYDPITNEKTSIYGKKGQNILKKFIREIEKNMN